MKLFRFSFLRRNFMVHHGVLTTIADGIDAGEVSSGFLVAVELHAGSSYVGVQRIVLATRLFSQRNLSDTDTTMLLLVLCFTSYLIPLFGAALKTPVQSTSRVVSSTQVWLTEKLNYFITS